MLFVVDDALVLNPIIVYPLLVIVGASTVHVVCVLYVLHDLASVLDNVAPLAFQFAVNAVLFLVIAYHVLLLLLLVNVNFFVDVL